LPILAERVCRRLVCRAPDARRIGCVDFREKRRTQHILSHSRLMGLRVLCEKAFTIEVPPRLSGNGIGLALQSDARQSPISALAPRPLAVEADRSVIVATIIADRSPEKAATARYPQRRLLSLAIEKLPLFALSLALCIVTLFAQRRTEAIRPLTELTVATRLENSLSAYGWYVGKSFGPTDLCVFYPLPIGTVPTDQVVAGIFVLVGISLLVLWPHRAREPMAIGWFWFLGSLVPVIGLVQVGLQSYADRYSYLPHIGFLVMVVFGTAALIDSRRSRQVIFATLAGAAIAACGMLTHVQVSYWKTNEALWQHALACVPGNWLAHYSIGSMRQDAGKIDEAIEHYRESIRGRPDFSQAHNRLGVLYEQLDRIPDAERAYAAALKFAPKFEKARDNLTALRKKHGKLELEETTAAGHNQYGLKLGRLRKTDEAIEQFRTAIRLQPTFVEAHYNLALALLQSNRDAEAKPHLLKALSLNPDFANAHFNLAVLLEGEGDIAGAKEHFAAVVRLRPQDKDARQAPAGTAAIASLDEKRGQASFFVQRLQ